MRGFLVGMAKYPNDWDQKSVPPKGHFVKDDGKK
jgi:hypothetical protein